MMPVILVALVAAYWLLAALLWIIQERRRERRELTEALGRVAAYEPGAPGRVVVVSGSIDLGRLLAVALVGPLLAGAVWVLLG